MVTNRKRQLLQDAVASGIESPKELANFMAQATHESMDLRRLEESFRYTKSSHQISGNVSSALREGREALEAARLEALGGKPQRLAELMYGGRMGNDEPGDGFKYRGRGYIQLTGKSGYREAGKALGLDLVNNPELAADPENASKIAVWYWNKRVHHVAPESVTRATRIINGGINGLEDRKSRFAKLEKELTLEVVVQLRQGEAPASAAPLHQGAKGTAVRELQTYLKAHGHTDARGSEIKVDGQFGPSTRHALESFQRSQDLEVTGVADRTTWNKLHEPTRTHVPAATASLDHPTHPDHGLFKQAQGGVRKLDAEVGRTSDQLSDNLAAALVVAARKEGVNRIDHISLSLDASKVFVMQGALDSPLKQIACVPTVDSLSTPIAQSTRALETVLHQKLSEQTVQQAQHSPTIAATVRM